MKKLFLYLAIAILVYVSAYEISNYFFKREIVPNSINQNENFVESFNNYIPIEKNSSEVTFSKHDNKQNSRQNNNQNNRQNKEQDYINVNKHCYIVGEKNGYVIVYLDNVGNVYDYTDVKMDVLEKTNNRIYNEIKDVIMIDNKEDLYRFLQAISS